MKSLKTATRAAILAVSLASLAGNAAADILLIEDQAGFGSLASNLRDEGYTVTVRNGERANIYANLLNATFLSQFSLIIYGERGSGADTVLPTNVGASLETYIQGGGNLLVTGWDSRFNDATLANLVRANSSNSIVPFQNTWNVVVDHPITNGPFGNFTGQTFTASGYDVSLGADTTRGAIELVAAGAPRVTGRIIFTDLPGNGGSVGFWNGGTSGTTGNAQLDFTDGGNPEAIFRNYVAHIEGVGPGFGGLAGDDVQVGDSDGDGFVTQVLDGSGASQVIGDAVSWSWTWSGGSAVGQKPEVTFPANNTTVFVTLTVTDGVGATYVDDLEVTVFTKTAGLFTDFADARYSGVDSSVTASRVVGTLEGDTLVIDPIGPGVPDIFRRAAGVWAASPFTETVTDIRAINDTTLFSGNLAAGTNFKVHRLVSGQWISTPLNLSAPPPIISRFDYAFDPQSVVFADLFNDTYGSSAGRVFAYDWPGTGNNWNHTELLPSGGGVAGARWGEKIAVGGDLVAVIGGVPASGEENLKIFRKSGNTWTLETPLGIGPDPLNPMYPDNFSGALAIGGGVVVTAVEAGLAGYVVVHEKIGMLWQQSGFRLEEMSADNNRVIGVDVDDDGLSFVLKDSIGNFLLFQRDAGAASWVAAGINSPRRLPLADLFADPQLTGISFSGGEIVISDPVSGVVRVFDKDVPFDTVNAAPKADAGEDYATTSYDGQPVMVFLDGTGTTDANYDEALEAEWTWAGGSATGLFASAEIDPSVTSVQLKITDSRGAVSRDTIAINIASPPVVDPGDDVIVVDSDGDATIRVNVSATLQSSDYPVDSWNWAWSGGSFSGQSGTLTLGAAANLQPVTLTALDENGLSSQTSFGFTMLSANPAPVTLQPVGGGPTDRYGDAAAIQNGVALIGAPNKPFAGSLTGASYLAQNLNGLWPQTQLAPGTRQGDSVLVAGDFAFVGAKRSAGNLFFDPGQVFIYRKSLSGWIFHQTLTTPPGASTFGASLAVSGDQLLIGAPQTFNVQNGAGAAFLYEYNGLSWTFVRRFDPPSLDVQGRFGTRVAIAGDLIAISQPRFVSASSVVTFEKMAGVWNFDSELFSDAPGPPQGNENYHFGQGLGLSESELLIGSPVEGVVYRRSRDAGNWAANGVINPNRYFFGSSIAMKDDVAVVGAVLENVGLGGAIPGSVTSFLLKNGSWQESGYLKLTPDIDPHIVGTPNFSAAVSFDGRDLIVGAPTARTSSGITSGKAYIYRNFAGLNRNANYEPLADAGANISVNDTVVRGPAPTYLITEPPGSEGVALNGSASTDQENGIVSYEWTWPGGSASGMIPNPLPRFPVGTTLVTLTVTDSMGIVNSDTLNVTVALSQTPPAALPATTNTLTVNLPVPGARWRLSSEFLWHGSGATASNVVLGETYQLEIIGYPGSSETVTTLATISSQNTVANLTLLLPLQPPTSGTVRFPETAQGFAWRLRGEPTWRNVTENGDSFVSLIPFTIPSGELVIDYRPVLGFTTPASQVINMQSGGTLTLNWNEYQSIDNFDSNKTFTAPSSPNLAGDPYQYVGMIRTDLGRGSGTVVAPRVVLTAAHLFFDSAGLQWADTQWFPRQQQDERQAPPITPRGIIFATSYARIVAPDSVPGNVVVPGDKKEVDFAVLFFSSEGAWTGGSANYLESTSARNWLTGTEMKNAVGYAQRSQQYEQRGRIFEKSFSSALSAIDSKPLPLLYQTGEVFGDGGASGSALFVQPATGSGFYPAAILLAGQDRAVYRVIDRDVGRMIQDAKDASLGSSEVLDSNSSLVTYGGLSGLRGLAVNIATPQALPTARWAVKPNVGTTYSNLAPTQRVGFSSTWSSVQVSFTAVPGYVTPRSLTIFSSQVPEGGVTTVTNVIYEPISGFDLWKQDRAIIIDSDDRDGDGHNALAEYAINGNPNSGTDPTPIRVSTAPLQNTYAEYEVFISSTADKIRYTVKASNTLPGTNVVTLGSFTKADGTNGYTRVTDTQPRSASSKRFAWVEYTHDRNLPAAP